MIYYDDSPTYQATENNPNPNGNTLGFVPISQLESTADCVKVLNHVIGQGQWKRVAKKGFQRGCYRPLPIRSFEDKNTNRVVSIQYHEPDQYGEMGKAWVYDFDLRAVQNEINQIADFCDKHYVCPDGGTILYDPVQKRVQISASDSFFIYTKDRANKAQVKIDAINYYEYENDWMVDPNKHIDVALPFVTEAFHVDEATVGEKHGFITIGEYQAFYNIGVDY